VQLNAVPIDYSRLYCCQNCNESSSTRSRPTPIWRAYAIWPPTLFSLCPSIYPFIFVLCLVLFASRLIDSSPCEKFFIANGNRLRLRTVYGKSGQIKVIEPHLTSPSILLCDIQWVCEAHLRFIVLSRQ